MGNINISESPRRRVNLSIIIVNWNTSDLLAQCLESVFVNPPAGGFEIIVVDNGSTDGSAAMVRNRFPTALLLENQHNPGFAAANNQAIGHARGRYLLLLNPDTVVMPDALDTLIRFMDDTPYAGVAGSMLLNPDGTLQQSCHPYPTIGREFWRLLHLDYLIPAGTYPMDKWPIDIPREVDSVQGASLMVRREVIEQVGLLDETFFMYSEEVDWCARISSAGWKIFWVPDSRIVHFGGQSTRQIPTEMFLQLYRAKLMYFRKHNGALYSYIYKIVLLIAAIPRILFMPVMWILEPENRDEHARMTANYSRLVISLLNL